MDLKHILRSIEHSVVQPSNSGSSGRNRIVKETPSHPRQQKKNTLLFQCISRNPATAGLRLLVGGVHEHRVVVRLSAGGNLLREPRA